MGEGHVVFCETMRTVLRFEAAMEVPSRSLLTLPLHSAFAK